MIRLLYLLYYFKQNDWHKYSTWVKYVCRIYNKSWFNLNIDVIYSSIKYNISLLEYFQFRFFEKTEEDRYKWAGTGYMYEYQKLMNPLDKRGVLDDKRLFYKLYRDFMIHTVVDKQELISSQSLANNLLASKSGKLVFKVADGKCGSSVEFRNSSDFSFGTLVEFMDKNNYDIVEEYVNQHQLLNQLSPSAVNTVRIFSQLTDEDNVIILGCRLRISVNSKVDNMAAGNLAAPIDDETGIINGPAVYSDFTKASETIHPITGVQIVGFSVPYWQEILSLVQDAHKRFPENRSIGWDIVVTDSGPGFIEGNHDWCKLVWQLPVNKGMKNILEDHRLRYLKNVR